MKGLDLSKFKKIAGDEHQTQMEHPDGHRITITHKALSPKMRRELQKIPALHKMAEGGEAQPASMTGGNGSPSIDPKKAKEVEAGATKSGWQPSEWKKNLKEGLGLAKGGDVPKEQGRGEGSLRMMAEGGDVEDKSSEKVDAEPIPEPTEPVAQAPVTINVGNQPSQQPPQQMPGLSPQPQSPQAQAIGNTPVQPVAKPQQPPSLIQDPNGQRLNDTVSGFGTQVQGITNEAQAQGQLGTAQAAQYQKQANQMQQLTSQYQKNLGDLQGQYSQYTQDIQQQKLDPHRFWNNRSTLGKIGTAIGLILGGAGAGLSHGENQALKFLNKQIDDDLGAQKADLEKKNNLLAANLRQFGNIRDATEATKIGQMYTIQAKLNEEAARAQDPIAKANAMKAIGQLQTQIAPMEQQLSLRRTLMQNPEALSGTDPAKFVQFVVPQHEQAAAYKELEQAQGMTRAKANIQSAFDQLAKINTAGNRIINPLQSTSQIAAIRDPLIAGLSKETAGRFTEQDAHYLSTLFPKPTDNADTLAIKRDRLNKLVSEKMNFPVLEGNGIPINKILSDRAQQQSSQQEAIVSWAKQNPNNPKAQKVLRKIGE